MTSEPNMAMIPAVPPNTNPVCEVSATSFTTDAAVGGVQVQLLLRLMVKGMDPTGLKGRVDPAPTSVHHAPFR
jgi:hypothetical protein